jgi:hypothetical protein
MAKTYVFDFYNLYIARGNKYSNDELKIRIIPLKLAEEFERQRRSFAKPYYRGSWKTAKCYIKAEDEENAKKLAIWLEFLYSFAQNRSVFFLGWYQYAKGKRFSSFEAKFVEPRENRFSELIHGVCTTGVFYTRDISLFLDNALKTLHESEENYAREILTVIHANSISHSELVYKLRFLICWIALEKLAQGYYSKLKSKKRVFSRGEVKTIKASLVQTLNTILKGHRGLPLLRKSVTRNFLYEHGTFEKVSIYLKSLDLGFENTKLDQMLKDLIRVRTGLVHRLESNLLDRQLELLFYLQKITENVIFRLLGVDRQMQSRLFLSQYNRGNRL